VTEPVPWVTAEDLRKWLDPSLRYAVDDDDEADRLIARATTLVLGATTMAPNRMVGAHREAMREAVALTVEQRIVTGVQGSVVGGRISIGHVTYGSDSASGSGTPAPPSVPAAALYALRSVGLLSTAVVAY
jgi:hypothetical protein